MRTRRNVRRNRRGTILVLSAFLMVAMMASLAMSIDIGYMYVARQQLQRTADAAALAAAWELFETDTATQGTQDVVAKASEFAAYNTVLGKAPSLATSDVSIGVLSDPANPQAGLDVSSTAPPNAVQVLVRRTDGQNGAINLFFARVLGFQKASIGASATASFISSIKGIRSTGGSSTSGMLPFALDEDTWNELMAGNASDDWKWDSENQQVVSGYDGKLEVNLFPQGTGSPGNRGTIDIGSNNNSTADIARQIVEGVSAADLEYHGGELKLDDNGELSLNGDTGISAGVKDELESIKGQPRVIPLFRSVSGNGNNAQYVIVKFVGVRIMEVKLTGKMSSKRVMIQPATTTLTGAIPSTSTTTSHGVYSPVRLTW